MKKWEKIEFQKLSSLFCTDNYHKLSDKKYCFESYSISFFLSFRSKNIKEYWLFYVEIIYRLLKCKMIETVGGYEENKLTLIVNLEDNPEYKNLTIKEFCSIIAERYRYREMDYMYEPSIYPIGEYESLLRKYGDSISINNLQDEVEEEETKRNYRVNEKFINEIEKIFDKNGVPWTGIYIFDTERTVNKKLEIINSEEETLNLKKPIEQTYDSIRNWLLPLLRKDDKTIFPKEEFLERVKLFDEAEKLRTFNVIKLAVEHDNYCVKFEEDKTIRGYEVAKAFGEMLGIAVEEEVVENVEEKEVEEEKKLTSQQLRKKYFLKRMKGENK